MNKIISIAYMTVGAMACALSVINIPLERLPSLVVGIAVLSSGISYVSSDYKLSEKPFFKRRPGFIYFLLVLLVPIFCAILKYGFNLGE